MMNIKKIAFLNMEHIVLSWNFILFENCPTSHWHPNGVFIVFTLHIFLLLLSSISANTFCVHAYTKTVHYVKCWWIDSLICSLCFPLIVDRFHSCCGAHYNVNISNADFSFVNSNNGTNAKWMSDRSEMNTWSKFKQEAK